MLQLNTGIIGGMAVAFSFFGAPQCAGQEATIYKVEEDWEMVISEPDPATFSPQITFFTSPSATNDDTYFQLQMNYYADEDVSAGGFHVAAVHGGGTVDEARSATQTILATDGDVIQWTSVMAAIDGKLLFAVKDGHCSQWGNFGGPHYLVTILGSSIADLSSYHHGQSLSTVDIGFGANRVTSVTLKRVRLFYSNGQSTILEVNAQP